MKKSSKAKTAGGRKFLREAFRLEQKLLEAKLQFSSGSLAHPGTQGEVTERYVLEVIRKYLPQRYAVASAIIIDSKGNTSEQQDIVIYDNQYTPFLLAHFDKRYIPSEAVHAVFEVKPTITKDYLIYASKKARSVRRLKRTSVPIVYSDGIRKPKELFPIVAGIIAKDMRWAAGVEARGFLSALNECVGFGVIDCVLAVSRGYYDTFGKARHSVDARTALPSFLFRLLDKLQSQGTVPAVNWNAYAASFSAKSRRPAK